MSPYNSSYLTWQWLIIAKVTILDRNPHIRFGPPSKIIEIRLYLRGVFTKYWYSL
jgi:hypothetical protein